MGSVGRMRSRHMRHDNAPERDEVKKDWILVKSGDSWPVISMYDWNIVFEKSVWWWSLVVVVVMSESDESESERLDGGERWFMDDFIFWILEKQSDLIWDSGLVCYSVL